jgi:hypothetical protein
MIHTPGVYYSIKSATNGYQGRVLAFIGNRRAMKEPTLICLSNEKTWQWLTGKAVNNDKKFRGHFGNLTNQGNLWKPGVNDGTPIDIKVPNLLAIPNCLVNVLQNQGTAATPADVLTVVNSLIASAVIQSLVVVSLLMQTHLLDDYHHGDIGFYTYADAQGGGYHVVQEHTNPLAFFCASVVINVFNEMSKRFTLI